jgi:hypothetical protein
VSVGISDQDASLLMLLCFQDFARFMQVKHLRDIDVHYQIARLRYAQSMADQEAALLFTRLAQQVQTYDQVVEVRVVLTALGIGMLMLHTVSRKSGSLSRWTRLHRSWVVPSQPGCKKVYSAASEYPAEVPGKSLLSGYHVESPNLSLCSLRHPRVC